MSLKKLKNIAKLIIQMFKAAWKKILIHYTLEIN